ncbi:MAG TPA: hypothetical protein VF666_16285 [Pyrinomonadaceae bacterium]
MCSTDAGLAGGIMRLLLQVEVEDHFPFVSKSIQRIAPHDASSKSTYDLIVLSPNADGFALPVER